jgi:hypothetical protein
MREEVLLGKEIAMEQFHQVQDSGERLEFASGAVRDTTMGKGRYDLLSPAALRRLAIHMQNGAEKYAARNWEKGMPLGRFFDSAVRHLYTWLDHVTKGTDQDEDHLAAAFWNIHCLIHTEEAIESGSLPERLDNLSPDRKAGIDG